ncbi:hypothetical protein E2C01_051686 [Portunus trituberculatus]|uniref:Uncharacterized protein n=1 Tax=Portunus trituberculatus TaxID=210409 RepID=A0A5B7GJJ0_PORTR|nr:hypothetical protein [Portunus trituberculatus]
MEPQGSPATVARLLPVGMGAGAATITTPVHDYERERYGQAKRRRAHPGVAGRQIARPRQASRQQVSVTH